VANDGNDSLHVLERSVVAPASDRVELGVDCPSLLLKKLEPRLPFCEIDEGRLRQSRQVNRWLLRDSALEYRCDYMGVLPILQRFSDGRIVEAHQGP
jgi:hypothetical protein